MQNLEYKKLYTNHKFPKNLYVQTKKNNNK